MTPIKSEYVQLKGIYFLSLFSFKNEQNDNANGFYKQYRNSIVACLRKEGDTIKWQNNITLTDDEQISPTFEEMILGSFLSLIDKRLPQHVMDHYVHLCGNAESIMEYKNDILSRVPSFFLEINSKLDLVPSNGTDHRSRYILKGALA